MSQPNTLPPHLFGREPEDLLRVAGYVAETGAALPPEIAAAARAVAPSLVRVPTARVRGGLETVLGGAHLGAGLQWLHDAGVLAIVMPEVEATVDFSQEAGRLHKDVWEHTKQVIRQSSDDRIVRWSALLHDIGKVPTRIIHGNGKVTFHRHAEVGARMFDKLSRRLEFPREDRGDIRFLIYNHLRANAYSRRWTDAAVRRFDKEMGANLQRLIDLSLADVTSRRPGRRQEARLNIEDLMRRIAEIRDLDAKVPPLPPGLGNAIMESFALPPGRRIGELRRLCEQAVEIGQLQERQDASYYVAFLLARGGADAPPFTDAELASTCEDESAAPGDDAGEEDGGADDEAS